MPRRMPGDPWRPEPMHVLMLPGAAFEDTAPDVPVGAMSPCSSSSSIGEWAVGRAHARDTDAAADAGMDGPLTRASLRLELQRFVHGPLLAHLKAATGDLLRACGAEAQAQGSMPPRVAASRAPQLEHCRRAASLPAPGRAQSPGERSSAFLMSPGRIAPNGRVSRRPVTPDSPDSPAPVLAMLAPARRRVSDGDAIPGLGLGGGVAALPQAQGPPSPRAAAGPAPPSPEVGVRASRLRAAAARPPSKEHVARQDCAPAPEAAESGGRGIAFSDGTRPPAQRPRSSGPLRSGRWLGVPKPPVAMKSLSGMRGKDILESGRFETFMGIVIALNAALIGFEVDWQARRETQEMPQMFGSTALYRFMDLTFFVIFLAELMLKLYVHRVQFLTRREVSVLWNWFDFLIVLMQVLEEAFTLLTGFFRSDVDLSSVRLLRVVRVLKVLRIIRFIDMFAELRRIVTSIMGSLKSLGWTIAWCLSNAHRIPLLLLLTMALLFLLMYIVGIFFVQQITTHMADLTEEALNERELRMRNYFGSLPDAWMSLWKAISGGIDWDVLAEPLEKELGLLLGWAFAAYIAFSLLAVMNVVTGHSGKVHVQERWTWENREKAPRQEARGAEDREKLDATPEEAPQSAMGAASELGSKWPVACRGEDSLIEERIIALFSSTDKLSLVHRGGRALITLKEIQARLEDPQFERDWKAINVSRSEAEYIFELLDVTGCGEIGVEDFVAACIRLHGGAKSIDVLTVMQEKSAQQQEAGGGVCLDARAGRQRAPCARGAAAARRRPGGAAAGPTAGRVGGGGGGLPQPRQAGAAAALGGESGAVGAAEEQRRPLPRDAG
ncbi:unnamed protein product [Prorocentrum cordatum]|uniref:EF-hand domain-containing protein n=1 Tax=Prorocentrum cordatum TaxID=2364126 RepID=A0ABN9SYF7_9DINO|nr:unnamed protein product [Polarella glacialis]